MSEMDWGPWIPLFLPEKNFFFILGFSITSLRSIDHLATNVPTVSYKHSLHWLNKIKALGSKVRSLLCLSCLHWLFDTKLWQILTIFLNHFIIFSRWGGIVSLTRCDLKATKVMLLTNCYLSMLLFFLGHISSFLQYHHSLSSTMSLLFLLLFSFFLLHSSLSFFHKPHLVISRNLVTYTLDEKYQHTDLVIQSVLWEPVMLISCRSLLEMHNLRLYHRASKSGSDF